jgi:hydroxyethylthiazole kinase-like uncharacterized protein yjeF
MKIFSAAQIRACDAYTIHASSIQSADLMEKAAERCLQWILLNLPQDSLFVILCGTGNNGGDGLALTRLLHNNGYGVKAFLIKYSEELSADCDVNLHRLESIDPSLVEILPADTFITDIPAHVVIIDAILGTGLNRPAEGWVASFIGQINTLPNRKIAVDIPSGLPADSVPARDAAVLKVDHTLSFQFYKRSFLHPETGRYAGAIHILDIELDDHFINATQTNYRIIDTTAIRSVYRPRNPFTHKGDYGSALIIGGSHGMMGAIGLTAKAVMRSGAGKLRAIIPSCGYDIFQSLCPEAMCSVNGDKYIDAIDGWKDFDAVGIGPGLGTEKHTALAFEAFIDSCTDPLVIDADAINLLSLTPDLLHKLPAGSVLTPHPREYERLFGKSPDSMLRLEHARTQAMRYNIVIVLKDHHTVIVTPEGEVWYNMTGNAGMATAGSGDVLTGIITGLFAQGYGSVNAAKLGVYLHGRAGDLAAESLSPEALIAGDVIGHLGLAFKSLSRS